MRTDGEAWTTVLCEDACDAEGHRMMALSWICSCETERLKKLPGTPRMRCVRRSTGGACNGLCMGGGGRGEGRYTWSCAGGGVSGSPPSGSETRKRQRPRHRSRGHSTDMATRRLDYIRLQHSSCVNMSGIEPSMGLLRLLVNSPHHHQVSTQTADGCMNIWS